MVERPILFVVVGLFHSLVALLLVYSFEVAKRSPREDMRDSKPRSDSSIVGKSIAQE